jgi:hypothetical protein
MPMTGAIDLIPAETEIFGGITLDQTKLFGDSGLAHRNGELTASLMKSLLYRAAIPEPRLKYFNDPSYRTGHLKGSRRQLFESNGTVGEEIYKHPNFLEYLRYFLLGADLPKRAIDEFSAKAEAYGRVGPSDSLELGKVARELTRNYGLTPWDAAEEFYKLALDCGIYQGHAIRIRDAVKRLRLGSR